MGYIVKKERFLKCELINIVVITGVSAAYWRRHVYKR